MSGTLYTESGPPSASLTGAGGEQTAAEVHSTLCALVSTEASKHPAWAEYAAILLDEQTAALFAACLAAKGATDGDESKSPPQKKKKQKLVAVGCGAESDADGGVPEVSLSVACLDGTTLGVTVPQRGLVCEVKRIVGQVRGRAQNLRRRLCVLRQKVASSD
jgi:hypothetical protein